MYSLQKLGTVSKPSARILVASRNRTCVRTMASAGNNAVKKVLIVGGVAGGASCAARLRRMSEDVEITIFERGPFVSFANCGLPYFVGGVIQEEAKLLVANAAKFKNWFNIDVKESTEVVAIDRAAKKVTTRQVLTGQEEQHTYDALVLAPGAAPIKPQMPGSDLPGIFAMKTIPDSKAVKAWIAERNVKRAVVVGAGFIGMEMAENLVHLGIETHVVEMGPQVMPPFDIEMVEPLQERMRAKGVQLHLGDGVAGFEQTQDGGLNVLTQAGKKHAADLVMLVIGVTPDSGLAKAAGLETNARGGIKVDDGMRTSDPHIWAVGDAVEVKDVVTGQQTMLPLAGPANRQGRISADVIMGREPSSFRGVQGTAVVGLFGMTLASTGASEKALLRAGLPFKRVYAHINNHAGYYPGATTIDIKLLFDPKDGRILGAQAVGEDGVEKRIDVIAMALQKGGTVYDLEEAELCYAPQYGSAKDPVNIAGMIAANLLRGDHPAISWDDLDWSHITSGAAVLLDVREPSELAARGAAPGALNIPLPQLRQRMAELPADKKVYVYCQVGQRGYYATRQLLLAGRDVVNVSGGWRSYQQAGIAEKLQQAKL